MEPVDRALVQHKIWSLTLQYETAPDTAKEKYAAFKTAETALKRARAMAWQKCPTMDGNRKLTVDDRESWVELDEEVVAAQDALNTADIDWRYASDQIWARNTAAELLRTLSADLRTEAQL